MGRQQLARYIFLLTKKVLATSPMSGAPVAEVVPGFGLATNVIPSMQYPGSMIRTWSGGTGNEGLRFYSPPLATRQPRNAPNTAPVPDPVPNAAPQPDPAPLTYSGPQRNPVPQLGPMGVPGPVVTAGAAVAGGVAVVGLAWWVLGGIALAA